MALCSSWLTRIAWWNSHTATYLTLMSDVPLRTYRDRIRHQKQPVAETYLQDPSMVATRMSIMIWGPYFLRKGWLHSSSRVVIIALYSVRQ